MSQLNLTTVMGLDPQTGYGRMALGLARGLRAAGVEVLLFPEPSAPTLVIGYGAAFTADHIARTRRWGFVMLDSDRPNPTLVDTLNEHCEGVLVPAPPMAEIFERFGLRVPIHVVPLGVDLFGVDPPPARPPHDGVTFLTYSYGEMRKGADLAVEAFVRGFGDDPRAELVIKARSGYQGGWLENLDHPRVSVVRGPLRQDEWVALLRQADCFVFPSRAEGWGMPPRDATLAGVPTIATQWLGLWDVDRWGLPLPVHHLRPTEFYENPFNAPDAHWAEPDVDVLVDLMRWVRDHPADARALAAAGRDHLLANYRWDQTGALVATILT
jgi:glycosyltransferase involved in cell wall biosynthesis